ncbi:MAG: helix-turn-helix domain-containing protein, partial [Gemmatimonadales bacterium]
AALRDVIREELSARTITPGEAAQDRGIDPGTLHRWRALGRVRGAKHGRKWTYRVADLDAVRGED